MLVYTPYTSGKSGTVAPLGKVKFKDHIKDLRKTAEAGCELKQRRRRAYVAQELMTLHHVIQQIPGLIGPKFPVVLAALTLAKAEILCYWRYSVSLH
jgi:NCK-associated protein 1